jgi:hypothetical protein
MTAYHISDIPPLHGVMTWLLNVKSPLPVGNLQGNRSGHMVFSDGPRHVEGGKYFRNNVIKRLDDLKGTGIRRALSYFRTSNKVLNRVMPTT